MRSQNERTGSSAITAEKLPLFGPEQPKPRVQNEICSVQQQVALAIRCSRALVRAYFDTAAEYGRKKKPFIGASDKALSRRMSEESVSRAEWENYVELWKARTDGQALNYANGAFTLTGLRSRRGNYGNYRPSIFLALNRLCAGIAPFSLINDWYRLDLRARYQLSDKPEFIEFAHEWFSHFNGLSSHAASRQQLLGLIPNNGNTARMWQEGLVEALEYLAVLQFSHRDLNGYLLRLKADPSFILTNILGRSTGIAGLDFLLFGGVVVPGDFGQEQGLSILVSGAPGTGKSTLGLALAAFWSARGGLSHYLRFEPDERSIVRQMTQFYRCLLPYFRLVDRSGGALFRSALSNQRTPSDQLGVLAISDLPTAPIQQIQDTALRIASEVQHCSLRDKLVVFDSISATEGYGESNESWRKFLFETTSLLKALGYVVVYLVEREGRSCDDFGDYVTDFSIRLQPMKTPNPLYGRRTIEVVKSRFQSSHRGHHVYSIETDAGMVVFPSSSAVLSSRRRRESRMRYEVASNLVDPGVHGFAECLNGQKAATCLGFVSWWREGSVTALIGPRGTSKVALAEVFVMNLPKDTDYSVSALCLHFAEEHPFFSEEFQRGLQRPAVAGLRYDIPVGNVGADGLGSTISHILFRSGHVAPGQVLASVREVIAEKRRIQTPIRRAMISDASNIAPNFPVIKDDPVFIPALCDLLKSEGITTVLVYSKPEHGAEDFVVDQVRSVSENIIRFEVDMNQSLSRRTILFVERSSDFSHDRSEFQLTESREGSERILKLQSLHARPIRKANRVKRQIRSSDID